jgi:hypothetical protein
VTIEVTLYIEPTVDADQIAKMGGRIVRWPPGTDSAPCQATFAFKNPARFDKFLFDALAFRGVALHSGQAAVDPDS